MPRQKPIKRLQQQQTLSDFLALPYYSGGYTDILYYEQLDVPLEELEDKTCVKVTWQNARGEQQNTYSIWVPKDAILADVARELLALRQAEAQTNPALALTTGRLRIMRVVNSRIQNNFNLNHKVSLIDPELVKLRAEEEAPEEQTKENDDVLVAVVHFLYDTPIVHYFDNPFMFLIRAVCFIPFHPSHSFSADPLPSRLTERNCGRDEAKTEGEAGDQGRGVGEMAFCDPLYCPEPSSLSDGRQRIDGPACRGLRCWTNLSRVGTPRHFAPEVSPTGEGSRHPRGQVKPKSQ
jgi:hypothetical protein